MEVYSIDVAEPTCWNDLVREYKPQILAIRQKMSGLLNQYMTYAQVAYSLYTGTIMYKEEIEEIAGVLEIPFLECLLLQLLYEINSACTSAILKYKDGHIHFRTMDWDLPELGNITVRLKIYRGEKYLYDAVGWVGCVGIFTGLKPNKYTISLNYRRNANPSILSNVMALFGGYFPNSYLIRDILESEDNPERRVKEAYVISPGYYTIMSGGFKGVIIRDRRNYTIRPAPYIQTNCDESGVGENILYSFERIEQMKKFLNKEVELDELIAESKIFPVNNEETLYTVIMSLSEILYMNVK